MFEQVPPILTAPPSKERLPNRPSSPKIVGPLSPKNESRLRDEDLLAAWDRAGELGLDKDTSAGFFGYGVFVPRVT